MEDEDTLVDCIKKQFLCCTPINRFDWKNSHKDVFDRMSLRLQKLILDNTVNSKLVKKYPIKRSYQRTFLKYFINELEKNCQETEDDVYKAYCDLVSSDDGKSSTQYRHFILDGKGTLDHITLQESISIVSQGTTGLCSWQAAIGLAEWCMMHKEVIGGKRILELGSGVGLTGLSVISNCSPEAFTFSDCHPAVLDMLCKNIENNFSLEDVGRNIRPDDGKLKLEAEYSEVCIRTVCLPWEEVDENLKGDWTAPDLVLAADVLYDDSVFEALSNALEYFLSRSCHFAIIAATVRNTDTISQFLKQLDRYNLTFEESAVPDPKVFIQSDNIPIRIIKILKSKEQSYSGS